MVKSIYKITNSINNKCYIGQTKDINRRFKEHKSMIDRSDGTARVLYQAMKKYGIENFTFEVIEENIENYDEREQYWIAYYNSYKNGYNMTQGGAAPPILKGDVNPNTTHNKLQVNEVIKLLRETNLSSKEIGKKTNYDPTAIIRINIGEMWYDETIKYPIRETLTKDYNDNRALMIIDDLLYTTLTQAEIAKKYGVGRTTVTAINNGRNCKQDDLVYPLRDKKANQQSKTVLMIDKDTNEVIKEFVDAVEAAKELSCSRSAIQLCCTGSTKTSCGYKWRYKDK